MSDEPSTLNRATAAQGYLYKVPNHGEGDAIYARRTLAYLNGTFLSWSDSSCSQERTSEEYSDNFYSIPSSLLHDARNLLI
jgi:hypothetical protein